MSNPVDVYVKKRNHSKGYVLLYCPNHPYCDSKGYVPEHRLIVENKLGVIINPKTHNVHHIDNNPANNNIDNLCLLTLKAHRRIHNGWFLENNKWFKTCSGCKKTLEVSSKNFWKRKNREKYISTCIECRNKIQKKGFKEKTCVVCKKTYIPKTGPAKYCSTDCMRVVLLSNKKVYNKRYKEKQLQKNNILIK